MFNFLKKKEKRDKTISPNDSIGDIAVKMAKQGIISVPKDKNHNSFGDSLDKLVDGELPWGWVAAKKGFIEPRDKRVMDLHIKSCKASSILEEKALIEQFLKAFYSYKKECEKRGECYVKYFSDMYEKCHNSSGTCFSMAAKKEERLAFINKNLNDMMATEQLKKRLLATLSKDAEKIIKQNPGILQSDLIKKFDPIVKNELSTLLYEWANQNKISREKHGRSYMISLK